MGPDLILLGQVTVDHVVPARPGAWVERIGGNALYAAAGARLWLAPERIGIVTRVGKGFPVDLPQLLHRAGIRHLALPPVDTEHLVEWIIYEEDGSRRSLPRNRALRTRGGEGASPSHAYLAHLERLSASVEDIPEPWLPARAVHLSPQVAARHAAAVAYLKQRVDLLSVDPSPHYTLDWEVAGIVELLAGANAFLPSEQEVGHLVRDNDWLGLGGAFHEAGFSDVCIKLGSRGVALVADGVCMRLPAAAADPVDPTGAGDSFCGAYAACRVQGMRPAEAARRALVTAAMVVECGGAEAALALHSSRANQRLATYR